MINGAILEQLWQPWLSMERCYPWWCENVVHITAPLREESTDDRWIPSQMAGSLMFSLALTHWVRVTLIYVVKLTIIGSNNGLSPRRRQAIIWNNAGILFIGPLGTNFIEILIRIQAFSFREMHLKMSYGKWRPFCLGLNVTRPGYQIYNRAVGNLKDQ